MEKVERVKPTISSSTIKMEDYKGKTIVHTIFDNCTFENFDDIKIINCNIHNCIFNDPKDYLKAMNNNKLTKCRTDFTTLLTMVIRSSSMDMARTHVGFTLRSVWFYPSSPRSAPIATRMPSGPL